MSILVVALSARLWRIGGRVGPDREAAVPVQSYKKIMEGLS